MRSGRYVQMLKQRDELMKQMKTGETIAFCNAKGSRIFKLVECVDNKSLRGNKIKDPIYDSYVDEGGYDGK